MVPDTVEIQQDAEALCTLAHICSVRGWVPATSGNFSLRDVESGHIFVSPSGIDKGELTPDLLLELTPEGAAVHDGKRPSAEAGLHVTIYNAQPEARAIAHVHTIWNTVLSLHCAAEGAVSLHGYELLKALVGVTSHWHCERIPVIANSQNYTDLERVLERTLKENPMAHGVLLSGHGLYTWGNSVDQTRRHLEALEFLFEVEGRRLSIGSGR